MNQLCRHIFPAGRHCTQPAVRTTLYCRHHQVIKRALAQVEPKPDPYGIYKPLPFVFPEDRAALQINFMLVAQALNDRSIHIQMANAFNRIFRSCEINLSRGPLTEPNTKTRTKKSAQDQDQDWDQHQDYDPACDPNIIHRVILTPQGEEISVPRTRFEENEAPLTHGKDCPCRVCAEEHRGAPLEEHHVDCKCGFAKKSSNHNQRPAIRTKLSCHPDRSEAKWRNPELSCHSHRSKTKWRDQQLNCHPDRSEAKWRDPRFLNPAT